MSESDTDAEDFEPFSYLAVANVTEPGYTEIGVTITQDVLDARNLLKEIADDDAPGDDALTRHRARRIVEILDGQLAKCEVDLPGR